MSPGTLYTSAEYPGVQSVSRKLCTSVKCPFIGGHFTLWHWFAIQILQDSRKPDLHLTKATMMLVNDRPLTSQNIVATHAHNLKVTSMMTLRHSNGKIDAAQSFGAGGEQKHNSTKQWPNTLSLLVINLMCVPVNDVSRLYVSRLCYWPFFCEQLLALRRCLLLHTYTTPLIFGHCTFALPRVKSSWTLIQCYTARE